MKVTALKFKEFFQILNYSYLVKSHIVEYLIQMAV